MWNAPDLTANGTLVAGGATLRSFLVDHNFSAATWDLCLSLPRAEHLTGAMRDRDAMLAMVMRMLDDDRQRAQCLVHGDAHLGNVCILPGEQASYLDWQTVMLGFWAHDVAYFLTAGMTVEDRREHERSLIRDYVIELNRAGGVLDQDEAWEEYRRHALYNFCWFPCHPDWQPEAIISANTARAVAAIEDLGTLSLWR
jgi:aminoglycoside phosphotransferase (APT) family kinase protein